MYGDVQCFVRKIILFQMGFEFISEVFYDYFSVLCVFFLIGRKNVFRVSWWSTVYRAGRSDTCLDFLRGDVCLTEAVLD